MFFPERILSIRPDYKVLEIGPGATPYFRSDVFLEKVYETEKELIEQSGRVGLLKTDKKVITYNGDKFPFQDKEFDYVVCSHVLEHVTDVDLFLSELQRVAKSGYLEFPTIYYDFIYNIPEHHVFLFHKNGIINWMPKKESGLNKYSNIQSFFFNSCELGYHSLIHSLKEYFFQGFEWHDTINSVCVDNLELLTYQNKDISLSPYHDSNSDEIDYTKVSIKKYFKFKINQIVK